MHRVRLFLTAMVAVAVVTMAAQVAVTETSAAPTRGGDFFLSASLTGRGLIGGDLHGRATVWIDLDQSARLACFRTRVLRAPRGLFFIARNNHGAVGAPILALRPARRRAGRQNRVRANGNLCLQGVSAQLIAQLGSHPGRFFVALSHGGARQVVMRGRLTSRPPGARSGSGVVTCTLRLYDDTGLGVAQVGYFTPNGVGALSQLGPYNNNPGGDYCSLEMYGILSTGAWQFDAYVDNYTDGRSKSYCNASGVIKCLGPQPGSVLSGPSVTAIYYLCTPGGWPGHPSYCATSSPSSASNRTRRRRGSD